MYYYYYYYSSSTVTTCTTTAVTTSTVIPQHAHYYFGHQQQHFLTERYDLELDCCYTVICATCVTSRDLFESSSVGFHLSIMFMLICKLIFIYGCIKVFLKLRALEQKQWTLMLVSSTNCFFEPLSYSIFLFKVWTWGWKSSNYNDGETDLNQIIVFSWRCYVWIKLKGRGFVWNLKSPISLCVSLSNFLYFSAPSLSKAHMLAVLLLAVVAVHSAPRCDINLDADCNEVYNISQASGVYPIYPFLTPVQVYCDMNTDGGKWTVSIIVLCWALINISILTDHVNSC